MTAVENQLCGWVLQLGRTEYAKVLAWQHGLVKMRREGVARDTIIIVEHPEVITVGRNGHNEHYSRLKEIPIKVERGGDVTYHGPGQMVVYFIFDLKRRGRDLHLFMKQIQQGIISSLARLGIESQAGTEYTGIWVNTRKIASIGIAVKNWISFHGAAINLNTSLDKFRQINPCGLEADVMVSARKLVRKKVNADQFADFLLAEYTKIFETVFYPVALGELAEDIESQSGGYTI